MGIKDVLMVVSGQLIVIETIKHDDQEPLAFYHVTSGGYTHKEVGGGIGGPYNL